MFRFQLLFTLLVFCAVPAESWSQEQSESRTETTQEKRFPRADPAIEGSWERSVETDRGVIRIIKEHHQHRTSVKVFDESGTLIQEKTSRYETDISGKVRIFTFYDSQYLTGNNQGQVDNTESSYLYRIDGNRFFEMYGILKADSRPVSILVWKRVKSAPER